MRPWDIQEIGLGYSRNQDRFSGFFILQGNKCLSGFGFMAFSIARLHGPSLAVFASFFTVSVAVMGWFP